jgi:cytoskeletal protein RodZ
LLGLVGLLSSGVLAVTFLPDLLSPDKSLTPSTPSQSTMTPLQSTTTPLQPTTTPLPSTPVSKTPVSTPKTPTPVKTPIPSVTPTPPPATPVVAATTGHVSATGAKEVWLEQDGRRVALGNVAPGKYRIKAVFEDGVVSGAGSVTVAAGARITLHCSTDFKQCK